ncbi:MAG: GntR family transcriptional regulator [Cognatishimia sp.]|uniref:GntR family transcriptional regulator n=1 Tax=Cognatishimia sp. TaxID=2211648 RepID=UPI003B8E5539
MTQGPKSKISDQITAVLTEQIVRGELVADEKLRQDHIAKNFAVSHVPVREALLRLEAKGLAVSQPRRGVRVAAFDPADMLEIREMRLALEPVALRYSIPSLTHQQKEEAEQARLACDQARDLVSWETENRRFHMAILAGCAMSRLLAEVNDLQILSARHLLATYSKNWVERTDRDHAAIMQAIRGKQTENAVAVLQRHLSRLS